ncbi:MAG: dihydrodipicolinate synthase family protein, partial [Planctomycetota bacterium]
HESLQSARRLANHAEGAGADAISLVPPAYFRTSSMETLVAGLAYVGEAAPSLPLYYYHVPRLSGANFRVLDLLQEVKDKVPSFVGVKFSAFEMDDLLRCIAFEDGLFDILFGSDEMLLAGMAMGAKGAVGSTYNFLGPYYHRVIEAFEAGRVDEARQHQHAVTCLVHTILRHGGHPALKAAMGILGKDCGPCRLPISTLTPHAVEALAGDLHGALHRAGDLPLGLKAKTRFRNV